MKIPNTDEEIGIVLTEALKKAQRQDRIKRFASKPQVVVLIGALIFVFVIETIKLYPTVKIIALSIKQTILP